MRRHDRHVIRFGYPRRSDQLFKWFGLVDDPGSGGPDGEPLRRRIDSDDFDLRHVVAEPQDLLRGLEVGDLSLAVVPSTSLSRLGASFLRVPVGATVGDRYGPQVVAREGVSREALSTHRIAVSDTADVAAQLLNALLAPHVPRLVEVARGDAVAAVVRGDADAALVHDESQVTYGDAGLSRLLDLGEWWKHRHALPLPLELVVLRREVIDRVGPRLTSLLSESLRHAMLHRDEALDYAAAEAGVTWDVAARYVDMYVNRWTRSFGEIGTAGLRALYTDLELSWDPSVLAEMSERPEPA